MKNTTIAELATALMLCACARGGEAAAVDVTTKSDVVTVNAESPILGKMVIDTVRMEAFASEFHTVGTVQAETGHYAEVGVPFDGRIIRSNVKLGSRVRAGQALFEMTSPEYLDASRTYLQSLKTYEKAKADYERRKELAEHGIVSRRELEEAYTDAENARQDKEFSEATLRIYGTDPALVKLGEPMKVVAPISGEIALNKLVVGSFTKADSDPLITITDLGKVWVTALVKERFIGAVKQGDTAEITSEADPGNAISGQIINVGNLVDEQTRSVQVVISCDNKDLKLKHGMYVSVRIISDSVPSVVVPSTAVFQGQDGSYVFVCTAEDNTFARRDVVLGSANADNTRICITDGLAPGDRIVMEGGLYLND